MAIEKDSETPTKGEPAVLRTVRTVLLAIVAFGVVGMGVELTLLGHFEEPVQGAPLIVLAGCLAVTTWQFLGTTATSIRAMQVLMALLIVTAFAGVGYHFLGNLEFKRELYPELAGLDLFVESVTGVTPVFAPGSMLLLGFVGLTAAYRHPCLTRGRSPGKESGAQQPPDTRRADAGAGE